MGSLKGLFIAITACGAVALLSGVSSAEMGSGAWKEHHQAQIKLLQDSAAALQKSNPELARQLTALAMEEMKEGEKEGKAIRRSWRGKQRSGPKRNTRPT